MPSKEKTIDLFESIANKDDCITRKDVRNLFIWYDLLSCVLPFQLILIFLYLTGSKCYFFTILPILFIFLIDSILKNSLERDTRNYEKFNKHIPLVKLWVVPLVLMGIINIVGFFITELGMI